MSIIERGRRSVGRWARVIADASVLSRRIDEAKVLAAQVLIERRRVREPLSSLQEAEFKVFSQFGDDGIIQYLLGVVHGLRPQFVEFGVENYREANTRFLLVHDNWSGLVMDASAAHVASIRADDISWRHDLCAVVAFIDRDNIDGYIRGAGLAGEIGLLSIDIDGNDYWVWERLTAVDPTIVVVEYNAVFGRRRSVTVPYDPRFQRHRAHASGLLWGASLGALVLLGARKGYAFVGCNGAGNNAYFVKRDRLGPLRPLPAAEGFVDSRFRDSRDAAGRLSFLRGHDRKAAIGEMEVWDLETEALVKVRDL